MDACKDLKLRREKRGEEVRKVFMNGSNEDQRLSSHEKERERRRRRKERGVKTRWKFGSEMMDDLFNDEQELFSTIDRFLKEAEPKVSKRFESMNDLYFRWNERFGWEKRCKNDKSFGSESKNVVGYPCGLRARSLRARALSVRERNERACEHAG